MIVQIHQYKREKRENHQAVAKVKEKSTFFKSKWNNFLPQFHKENFQQKSKKSGKIVAYSNNLQPIDIFLI